MVSLIRMFGLSFEVVMNRVLFEVDRNGRCCIDLCLRKMLC